MGGCSCKRTGCAKMKAGEPPILYAVTLAGKQHMMKARSPKKGSLMKLCVLLEKIQHAVIKMPGSEEEMEIRGITCNSQKAEENSLFVCIQGSRSDGHEYIEEAGRRGASCVLVEKLVSGGRMLKFPEHMAVILVKDTREALAGISSIWFGNPAGQLKVIGVTGTKGKSTVAVMIREMLESLGEKCGLIGTIENDLGNEVVTSPNTTPDAFTIQEYFAKMIEAGCHYVVMEVSSQGIKQHRIDGIWFEIAVFTNFGEDHIGPGEHASLGEYRYYKSRLFEQCRIGIGNLDDVQCSYMFQRKCCAKYGFTCREKERQERGVRNSHVLTAEKIQFLIEGGELKTVFYADNRKYELALPGKFNVYNALAALQTVSCLGFDREKAGDVLKHLTVRGRMEQVDAGGDFLCYIDYAHNAMSLEEVLKMLKIYGPERILLVFGCGGNRAGSRRGRMGKVAGELADLTIITSDNPRWEDPVKIMADIEDGIRETSGVYQMIPDREDAVRFAVEMARRGDILLIAGKGHENYQEIQGIRYPMDDRELVRKAIKMVAQKRQEKERTECTQTLL